jgi:hypothetical protein
MKSNTLLLIDFAARPQVRACTQRKRFEALTPLLATLVFLFTLPAPTFVRRANLLKRRWFQHSQFFFPGSSRQSHHL